MTSIRKRHEDFIREIQAPLKALNSHNNHNEKTDSDISSDDSNSDKLIEELQKKFDELFGFDDCDD